MKTNIIGQQTIHKYTINLKIFQINNMIYIFILYFLFFLYLIHYLLASNPLNLFIKNYTYLYQFN